MNVLLAVSRVVVVVSCTRKMLNLASIEVVSRLLLGGGEIEGGPGASMVDGEVVDPTEGHSAGDADDPDCHHPPPHRPLLPTPSGGRVGAAQHTWSTSISLPPSLHE